MSLFRRALLFGAAPLAMPALHATAGAEHAHIIFPLEVEPDILVPGVSHAPVTRLLGSKIYRGLVRFDATGPQPDLATAWEVSSDGLTYVFYLRLGVTWHDSGGFGPGDVSFSLHPLPPSTSAGSGVGASAGHSRHRRTTRSRSRFGAPFSPFLRQLDALSAPIVPQHVHDRPGFGLDPRRFTPVGTGPFQVTDWLSLKRFEWFVGTRPQLDEIACPILTSDTARVAALEGSPGLLTAESFDTALLLRVRREGILAVANAYPPTSSAIAGVRLNLAMKPLDDPRVRRALAGAVDRAAVLRSAWGGFGRPATGPTVEGSQDRNPSASLAPFDPRASSNLLTLAGLRPGGEGVRLHLRHLMPPGAPWEALADIFRKAVQRIGVELIVDPVTMAECEARVATGDYETVGFSTVQTGDPSLDLSTYDVELPDLAPLLNYDWDVVTRVAGIGKAQEVLATETLRLWLVEPSLPVAHDLRLSFPGGPYSDFSAATLS